MLEQAPEVDLLFVAIGGGGLAAGVGAAARLLRPGIRVVGVEPVGAPTLHASLEAGHVVELARIETKAGTLAPRTTDPFVFDIVRNVVDEIVLVTDDEMKDAARLLLATAYVGVELSGAAALAAFLKVGRGHARHPCVLVCGAGTDALG
jgi:threonine dehydratase